MDAQNETNFDIRDILWQARRYRWMIALPIVVALCGAFVYYKTATPVYQSFVVLQVGDRSALSPNLEALARPEREGYTSPRDRVALLDNRIHGRGFLSTLVDRLGFARNPAAMAEAREAAKQWEGISPEEYAIRTSITRLGRKISVMSLQGQLVRIVASDQSPVEARKIADAVSSLLIEQSRKSSLERAQARGAFSADQIAIYQERLRRSEEALRNFQESLIGRGLSTSMVDENNLETARNLIRLNEEEMEQVRGRIATERSTWDTATGGSVTIPDLSSPTAQRTESRLVELESSYAQAQLGGDKTASDLPALRTKIAEARQALYSEYEGLAAALSGRYSESARAAAAGIALDRSILRSLRDKGRRLTTQVNAFSQTVRNSPRDQMELSRLRGDVETNRQLLATLQKEVTSSRLTEALETSELGVRLDIVEPAQVPLSPVFPNRLRIFGAALLLGPMISLGLIFAMEKLGAVVRTVEQAEREIGVPVIGTVPRVEGWSRPGSFLQNHWPALSIVLVLLLTGIFYTVHNANRSEETRPRSGTVGRP